jgi:hypothetical protein
MDRKGDLGIGYSFGAIPTILASVSPRATNDPRGQLTFHESVLAEGQASQTGSFALEDCTNITVDPSDVCTFWFAGSYLKRAARSSTTRIGSFVLPGCR